ncbi:hypothetical protein [Methanobrevibacter sp.]
MYLLGNESCFLKVFIHIWRKSMASALAIAINIVSVILAVISLYMALC